VEENELHKLDFG